MLMNKIACKIDDTTNKYKNNNQKRAASFLVLKSLLFSLIMMIPLNLSAMEYDKKLHLGMGTSIGFFTQSFIDDPMISFMACSSAGLAKEIYDEIDYGGADHRDLLFSMFGCAVGVYTSKTVGLKFIPEKDGGMISIKVEF